MNTDTINDPRNKLNYYVNESFKGLNQLINDPLILVNFTTIRNHIFKLIQIFYLSSSRVAGYL